MPKHLTVESIAGTSSLGATPPAYSTPVTVPSGILGRFIGGSYILGATALQSAQIVFQVDDGAGGAFATRQVNRAGAGLAAAIRVPFGFFLPPGYRYQFVELGSGGTTETIEHYSIVDVG